MTLPQSVEFTATWHHGDIREIFQDVFFLTRTNKIHFAGEDIQTSRNMTIIRNGSKLTLLNTVSLSNKGLRKLDLLGKFINI